MAMAVTPKNGFAVTMKPLTKLQRQFVKETVNNAITKGHIRVLMKDEPPLIIKPRRDYKGKRSHHSTGHLDQVKVRNKQICTYYNEGHTLKECAARFECKVGSVRHALSSNGVPTRDSHGRTKKL